MTNRPSSNNTQLQITKTRIHTHGKLWFLSISFLLRSHISKQQRAFSPTADYVLYYNYSYKAKIFFEKKRIQRQKQTGFYRRYFCVRRNQTRKLFPRKLTIRYMQVIKVIIPNYLLRKRVQTNNFRKLCIVLFNKI